MSKEQIVEQLKTGVVALSFIKADGSNRSGRFTLNGDVPAAKALLEAIEASDAPTVKGDNISAIELLDNGSAQWRSVNLATATVNA